MWSVNIGAILSTAGRSLGNNKRRESGEKIQKEVAFNEIFFSSFWTKIRSLYKKQVFAVLGKRNEKKECNLNFGKSSFMHKKEDFHLNPDAVFPEQMNVSE